MQVRLAHEQGLLSHPSLNMVQSWALSYWMGLKQAETQVALMNTAAPEVSVEISDNGDRGQAFGGAPELPITDPQDLDTWFESLSAKRGMTGAEVLGYAEPGTGVRV